MPLKSQAQRQWMADNRPDLLSTFEAETPQGTSLPPRAPKPPKPQPPKHLSKAQPKHLHLSKGKSHRPQGR